MKKIQKSSELMWVFGIVFVALGVAICSKANLGVSMIAAPAFIVNEAIAPLSSFFSVGVTEYIIQGLMLIILCIVVGKFNWRYLLGFAVAVLYGYTLDLFLVILGDIEFGTIWLRYIMLIVGDVTIAFGVACFFRTYMPLQVHELFVAELVDRFHIDINKTKTVFDYSMLLLSVVLALALLRDFDSFDWSTITHTSFHNIGVGTIITTLINSPLIKIMGKLVDKLFGSEPRFNGLYNVLKRN